jgi:hypothetical protein
MPTTAIDLSTLPEPVGDVTAIEGLGSTVASREVFGFLGVDDTRK